MFFRPSFCANCGEKIERTDWGIFTSRRFCPVCESEFKGQDLIPRVIVGAGLLIGIFGFGSYLKSGNVGNGGSLPREPARLTGQSRTTPLPPAAATPEARQESTQPSTLASLPPVKAKPEADEVVYYCGAETKKGTPCSRRVKGNVRCFQHKGMPAMLPPEKLRIG